MTKDQAREQARQSRDAIPADLREEGSRAAAAALAQSDWFKQADQVLLYLPIRSEMDSAPLAVLAREAGKGVYAPVVDSARKSVTFYRFEEGEAFEKGEYGVLAPRPITSRPLRYGTDER